MTTFIDMDLYEELNSEARRIGVGYQTLLNERLRQGIESRKAATRSVENIERDLIKEALMHVIEEEAEPLSRKMASFVVQSKPKG